QKLYAPIADLANSNAHFELEEAYQIEWNTQQVSIQNEQNYSSLSKTIQFEVTGDNGSVVLNLSNSSYSIHGSYYFKLSGPGMDSSSSGGISSIGSGYDSKVIGSGLKAGHYTLTVQVNSPSTLIELDITQNIQVEEKIFDGYQQVSGNVFADDSGQIKTPENYMLQVGKQKIIYQSGIANAEPIIHQTEHGTLTLNADGSYRYQSKWTEQGTAAKGLNDQLNIKISSLDGSNSIDYALKVTTDITPPIAGEIIFTDFNDSGISDTDFITNDQEFSIDIQGNEQGSFVEYQYSTDQGQTWSLFEKEMWSYFEEGQYSFRAKVTDAVGNESYTAEKQVTVDITGPDLQNLFSYDVQTDHIVLNPPEESYQLTQWIAGQWVEVDIKAPLAWTDSSQYKVTATDFTGNTTEQIIHIAQISGTFKPENSAQINIIKGSEEDDYLYGGDGDDTLISFIGKDQLDGGDGNDTLIVKSGAG
ncbi:Ig-like domain-containing protein, partial [Acinetobacter rudis]